MEENTLCPQLNSQEFNLIPNGYSLSLPDIKDEGSSNKIEYLSGDKNNLSNELDVLNNFINTHFEQNIVNNFYILKKYETKYSDIADSSADLFKKWQEGSLKFRNSEINEWLSTYMQIRNFIHD